MNQAMQFSVLDLCPVGVGQTATEALDNSLLLSVLADELGYKRYWFAEHHAMGAIASSSPEIMISQVARATKHLRVGSGGIMLPNHPALRVAENFRTLEALFPGRIDLGLGRAPGTNGRTAIALRRNAATQSADDFPEQLEELEGFLSDDFPEGHPYASIRAMPQGTGKPEIWLLGSSDYSAQMAAEQGRPFSFAHHFSPLPAELVLRLYRDRFRPSLAQAKPHAMVGVNVICAETDEEAERLASSGDLAFLRLRQTGRFDPVPTVEQALATKYSPQERYEIDEHRQKAFVGSPATVRANLLPFLDRIGAQEAIISTMVHNPEARRRSYRLVAKALDMKANA
ncbi:MAG: LLM class flavin-dependent oxidoreductase [Proteobacteria bacterium]|nr:MAG: LLM class flavin-dependent oxidoreductase [Pseudomonadota bacterium]